MTARSHTRTILALCGIFAATASQATVGNCSIYTKTPSSECPKQCGRCFNPGSRPGVICTDGSTTGYYCHNTSFACMDWTFGSAYMRKAEGDFLRQENISAYFGVGSFGSSDPMGGLGVCLRVAVDGLDRDLIVQSVNTGPDVQGNQFDMQMGDGGFGANNRCAGPPGAMYPGGTDPWGAMYGGVSTRANCSFLPKYPKEAAPMQQAGDDLVSLCQYSFDKGLRPANPTIRDMRRVRCPPALVNATWMQRVDDPAGYDGPSLHGFPNTAVTCQANPWDLSYCLTRMMDCCKPSAAWIDNIKPSLMVEGKRVVQTCTADGYTRVDVQCGCFDCDC